MDIAMVVATDIVTVMAMVVAVGMALTLIIIVAVTVPKIGRFLGALRKFLSGVNSTKNL